MLNLDQPEDQKRVDWIEKYVIAIDFYIKDDEDPRFVITFVDDGEEHMIMCDGPTLRVALDRAMETTKGDAS
jgi:hypothetical protein